MDPKVNEQLAELLAFVKKGAEATTDFAVEQAPLVAREIVAWTFWHAIAGCLLAVFAAAFAFWCGRVVKRWANRRDVGEELMFPVFGAAAAGLVAVGLLVTNAPAAIKVAVAPRLVIIDYIGKLTK